MQVQSKLCPAAQCNGLMPAGSQVDAAVDAAEPDLLGQGQTAEGAAASQQGRLNADKQEESDSAALVIEEDAEEQPGIEAQLADDVQGSGSDFRTSTQLSISLQRIQEKEWLCLGL